MNRGRRIPRPGGFPMTPVAEQTAVNVPVDTVSEVVGVWHRSRPSFRRRRVTARPMRRAKSERKKKKKTGGEIEGARGSRKIVRITVEFLIGGMVGRLHWGRTRSRRPARRRGMISGGRLRPLSPPCLHEGRFPPRQDGPFPRFRLRKCFAGLATRPSTITRPLPGQRGRIVARRRDESPPPPTSRVPAFPPKRA